MLIGVHVLTICCDNFKHPRDYDNVKVFTGDDYRDAADKAKEAGWRLWPGSQLCACPACSEPDEPHYVSLSELHEQRRVAHGASDTKALPDH